MSSIFVQIASYNDDELSKTVQDCIKQSSGDNEIFFGIHECYIENKTEFNIDNVRIQYSKAPENLGVGVARYLANKLYDNEDYYLQIDSHTRFRKNWDQIIINNLNRYTEEGNDCILTGYPPGYWYDQEGSEILDLNAETTLIKIKKWFEVERFKEKRIMSQEGVPFNTSYCSDSVSAGFIFGRGEIHNVKQHPSIFYFGEEFLRAASFYTHGYNLIAPDIPVVFHLYGINSSRIPCWETYPEETSRLEEISVSTIKSLLSDYDRDPTYSTWMGNKRSLEMYGRYLGLNFKHGTIY